MPTVHAAHSYKDHPYLSVCLRCSELNFHATKVIDWICKTKTVSCSSYLKSQKYPVQLMACYLLYSRMENDGELSKRGMSEKHQLLVWKPQLRANDECDFVNSSTFGVLVNFPLLFNPPVVHSIRKKTKPIFNCSGCLSMCVHTSILRFNYGIADTYANER